jgi:hypothetical protein
MVILLLSFLISCTSAPSDKLTWREQWEVLILTEDGGLIDGRVSTGNTGMVRGEGQFRANRWFSHASPILFGMDGGPADVDISPAHDAVRVGSALMGRFESGDHWTMRFSNDSANAIVYIDPGGPQPPISTTVIDGGQWTIASAITHGKSHGWFTAGRRGGIFQGQAVTFHRGGDSIPNLPRKTLVIMGHGVSIGVDHQGSQRLEWARIGDIDIPRDDLQLSIDSTGGATLDFRPTAPLVIHLEATTAGGSTPTHEGLIPPETWLVDAAQLGLSRMVRRVKTTFEYDGEAHTVSGIIVEVN